VTTPSAGGVTLWIDADATPRDVKDIVVRAAERRGVRTVFVANQRVVVPPGQTTITAVRVDGGPDVADRYIAEHAAAGDVAITADIPLARRPRGEARGDHRPARRAVHRGERGRAALGARLHGRPALHRRRHRRAPAAFGPRDKQAFASTLDRVLTRALR
jgi:uncharacterized protein YaiI (UPF0178 family)